MSRKTKRKRRKRGGGKSSARAISFWVVPVRGECPSPGPWPIFVVGPGRCGSSTTARILHTKLGITMGWRFHEPDDANKKGYFEDLDFQFANAMVLGGWARRPMFRREYLESQPKFMEGWRAYVEYVVKLRWKMNEPWGLKDPFLSDFLDVYAGVCPTCRIIRCHRPAEKVIASFMRIYGWSREKTLRAVLTREAMLDEILWRLDRPVLSLRYGENPTDEQLESKIGEWLETTSENNGRGDVPRTRSTCA